MKKINILLLAFACMLGFSACDSDEDQIYDKKGNPTTPVLSVDGSTNIIVDEANTDLLNLSPAVLTWSKANFGKGIAVSYAMELSNEEDFSENKEVEELGENASLRSLTAGELAEWAFHKYGGYNSETELYTPTALYFRIKATEVGNVNNFVYSNSSIVVVDGPEPEDEGPLVVSWKLTTGDWAETAIYAWGDSEVFGEWPGQQVTPNADGWFSVVLPKGMTSLNLIINNNNNGSQLNLVADPTQAVCFLVDVDASTATAADECPTVLRWKELTPTWDGMAIYAWGGSPLGDVFGGWPGEVVTADANGWYQVVLSPGQDSGNVIWNNNNGGKQIEPGPVSLTESACFVIDTDGLFWEYSDCE